MHCAYAHTFQAMGGPAEIQCYADHAAQAQHWCRLAEAEVRRLEAKYSRFLPDSLLSRLNAAAGESAITVDAETAGLLDYAAIAHAQSDGRFDITSGVLRRVWDFRRGIVPSAAQLAAVLPLVGWQQVRWQRPQLQLPAGMELDLGGMVKEYAADRAAAVMQQHGSRSHWVNLAGDIAIGGPPPHGAWRIGLQHPRQPGALAVVDVWQGGLASSGDYERYIEVDGQRHHHILDPRSGWPVPGVQGVSILAPQTLVAGSIATTAMLYGHEALTYLQRCGLPYWLVDAAGVLQHGGG